MRYISRQIGNRHVRLPLTKAKTKAGGVTGARILQGVCPGQHEICYAQMSDIQRFHTKCVQI